MKYTITNTIETTTSTGKPMYKTTFKDEQGKEQTCNVFEKLSGEVEGELYTNEKGYLNFKTAKKVASGNFMANQKAEQIAVAQERKEAAINRAMDRKDMTIAYFNSRNTAIEFVKTFPAKSLMSPSEALAMVNTYTDIFYKEWEKWDSLPF